MRKSKIFNNEDKFNVVMMFLINITIFMIVTYLCTHSKDCVADCNQFYPNNTKITVKNNVELCNSFYVISYDDVNKRNIFSSELLQPNGHDLKRHDSFHPDTRLKNPVKPQEYHDSGFDKGHMVPSDDSTSYDEMNDTFLMTNMTPQDPKLNRGSWKKLETQVRSMVQASGKPAIVVTGALYETYSMLGRIPVPTGYYKIVYISGAQPRAFIADNNDTSAPHPVQLSTIKAKTGITFP